MADEECWEYLDPKGVRRGPFKGSQMAAWYDNHLLPPELEVRHSPAMPYIPIRDLFIRMDLHPFRSKPQPVGYGVSAPKCLHQWQYRDRQGQLQGPFTSQQMAFWHERKMLPADLLLRRVGDVAFATIPEFFPRNLVPFVSQPVDPAPQPPKPKQPQQAQAVAVGKQPQVDGFRPDLVALGLHQPSAPGPQGPSPAGQVAVPPASKQKEKASAAQQQEQSAAAAAKQEGSKAGGKGAAEGAGGKGGRGGKEKHNTTAGETEKGAALPVGEVTGGKDGKSKGRGKNSVKQQQQAVWNWATDSWSTPNAQEAWWECSRWTGNGWAEGDWESQSNHKGAIWKGSSGEDGKGGPIGGPAQAKEKGEKYSGVQAVFGSLRWGPQSEVADLFPEGVLRKVLDESIVWEERWISPLAVRFSQGKIHPFFHERGPICEVMLQIKCTEDAAGLAGSGSGGGKEVVKRIEPPFPPIRLLHLKQQAWARQEPDGRAASVLRSLESQKGVLVTLDNRRLYALQRFALQEWPSICLARALCVDELTPTRLRAENRKFTNRVCGLTLEVESRSNAFDTFSWVTEAARIEAARFCRPVSFKACDKALSLLPMLVVHIIQRSHRLLESRWPGLSFVAQLLPNPGPRLFPSKRLLMLHVLELSRIGRSVQLCPAVCVGYKSETVVTLSKGKSCVTSKLSVQKPLALIKAASPTSCIQRQVLAALAPFLCVPYAEHALIGTTRQQVVAVLLAWGKVAAWRLRIPDGP